MRTRARQGAARSTPLLRLVAALAVAAVVLPAGGCRRGGPASGPGGVEAPVGVVTPEPPEQAPSDPSEVALSSALQAMGEGRLAEATTELESIVSTGGAARERARYALALILARPDNGSRDTARAASLLQEYLATDPDPPEESSARLILGLLDLESRYAGQIRELREKAAASGAESEDLRLALAQREAELRRIKDILLDRSGGL